MSDVAVKRWSKFTGRAAVLADDGRTFNEIAQARGVPSGAQRTGQAERDMEWDDVFPWFTLAILGALGSP